MVCTANDLLEWKDFPKGLRVLLLDKDVTSATEIRSKLQGMDYIVYTFCNEDEASNAVSNKSEIFHVAIVEVSTINCDGTFKFLQLVKDIPTIMTTSVQCLSTTMKCIALGAIEVLNKPLCEDKLRNIWQHVAHKAYNAGESLVAESTPPVQVCMFSSVKNEKPENGLIKEMSCISDNLLEEEHDRSSGNDKYPAPSTPQLKQGVRLLDDAECHDQTNWSTEKDSAEHCEESKSVETTSCDAAPDMPGEADQPMCEAVIKEENDSADGCRSESGTSLHQKDQQDIGSLNGKTRTQNKRSECPSPCGAKANRKKMKVDWTSDLHKKFVQAVEQLGVDQAIPSRILELMKVDGLTRHNVASHLQKYRMHRKHSLPKREERRISARPKDTVQSGYYYHHKPIMAYPPPYHPNQTLVANQAYPMWGQPSNYSAGHQVWGPAGPPYQPWPWKSYTAMQADAWGCPVMPPLQGSYSYPQNASGYYGGVDNWYSVPAISTTDHHMAEEVIDKIVKEAISKPWLPLPLGLKPPSAESVLSELAKQGISHIPPRSH